jgi:hypothetical protein
LKSRPLSKKYLFITPLKKDKWFWVSKAFLEKKPALKVERFSKMSRKNTNEKKYIFRTYHNMT